MSDVINLLHHWDPLFDLELGRVCEWKQASRSKKHQRKPNLNTEVRWNRTEVLERCTDEYQTLVQGLIKGCREWTRPRNRDESIVLFVEVLGTKCKYLSLELSELEWNWNRQESREDILLTISEELYRPLPANPCPAPKSEEEDELPNPPHVLGKEAVSVPADLHGLVPASNEQTEYPPTLQPPSPVWGNNNTISLSPQAPATPLMLEPSPSAVPPLVTNLSLKE
ncbi:hypothetical protein DFH08DRAFT_825379 [Mycena albidolilacea]|uniref:Uncharacterized protein n=1 Tax=Mycena albidolilacea TaxID=1033008 RepID=A0AAD6Z2E9_9AGAR|nr:hypothetical protein DFH08DRAFT_825379 [Mycena albidolilacea]